MTHTGTTLLRTVFVSTSVGPIDNEALAALVTSSRARNRRLGICSVLMLFRGTFMHAMEGDPGLTNELLERVRRDPRHHSIYMMIQELDTQRQLPSWPMVGGPCIQELSPNWIPGQAAGASELDPCFLETPCMKVFAAMQRRS